MESSRKVTVTFIEFLLKIAVAERNFQMKVTIPEKELGEIALQHGYPNGKLIRELIAIGYHRGILAIQKSLHRAILRQIARHFGNVPITIQ
jgi:hypothetical protein